MLLRLAQEKDLPDICAIFNEVIASGNTIYQTHLYTLAEIKNWFSSKCERGYPVIVAERENQVLGFGSYDAFRARESYKTTAELAVHLYKQYRGQGVGTKIILDLLTRAQAQGIHVMVSCIDSANTGSIRLHERLGFQHVGRMPEVARKNDQWLDLVIMQRTTRSK
ncbi:MAG: N-acetyltransferase [Bdellovibrionaceae bacterium]|nr:N-acetyltransferase [Pseudobdellovibrionaceae bacterium]